MCTPSPRMYWLASFHPLIVLGRASTPLLTTPSPNRSVSSTTSSSVSGSCSRHLPLTNYALFQLSFFHFFRPNIPTITYFLSMDSTSSSRRLAPSSRCQDLPQVPLCGLASLLTLRSSSLFTSRSFELFLNLPLHLKTPLSAHLAPIYRAPTRESRVPHSLW